MNLTTKVIHRIKYYCDKKGINPNQLASLSNLRQSTVDTILRGKTKSPQLISIKKICDGLGITLIEFFDSPEFMEPEGKDDPNE